MSNEHCSFKAMCYVAHTNSVSCEKKEFEYFKMLRKLLTLAAILLGAKNSEILSKL